MTSRTPVPDPARAAARWAAPLLVMTLVAGVWMRAIVLWPALGAGLRFEHLVHAHSHVAFFGWLVLGVAAIAARRSTLGAARAARLVRLLHAVGALNVATFVAFAWQGYGAASITASALHVAGWGALAWLLWPMARATPDERWLMRLALGVLLVAGAATLLPGVLKARGIESGWWRAFGISLFLALFVHGFVGVAALAATVSRLTDARGLRAAALLMVLGTPLAGALYVALPPPVPWLVPLGRAGLGVLGVGTLMFAARAVRSPLPPLLAAAAWGAGVAGALELLAAGGVGLALLHGRPIVLAVSHLLLVGVATPCVMHACRDRVATPGLAGLAVGGGALMIGTLAVMGWPWALGVLAGAGLSFTLLLQFCFLGGTVLAVAFVTVILTAAPLEGHPHELPVVASRRAEPADAGGALSAR